MTRITIREGEQFPLIEYGRIFFRDLTKAEEEELKTLREHLANFSEFNTANKLQDGQLDGVMAKKKRLEILEQLPSEPQIEWMNADPQPESLLLVCRPDQKISYVENMPEYLFEALFKQEINVKVETQAYPVQMHPEAQTDFSQNKVEKALYELQSEKKEGKSVLSADWKELVEIEEKEDFYWIKPKIWLNEDYKPLDDTMQGKLGGKWVSKGKGDKNIHWEVPK